MATELKELPSPTGRYTGQWWYYQFVGVNLRLNEIEAKLSLDTLDSRLRAAHKRIDELVTENESLKLAVGEALAKSDAVTARLDALVVRLKEKFTERTMTNGENANGREEKQAGR